MLPSTFSYMILLKITTEIQQADLPNFSAADKKTFYIFPHKEDPNHFFSGFYNDANKPSILTTTFQNYLVTKSTFTSCRSTSNGGALALTASGSKLLIEMTFFKDCKCETSQFGGCIYMEISDGSGGFIMKFVCGTGSNCIQSGYSWGQFTYVSFKTKNCNAYNYVLHSSIINCT